MEVVVQEVIRDRTLLISVGARCVCDLNLESRSRRDLRLVVVGGGGLFLFLPMSL